MQPDWEKSLRDALALHPLASYHAGQSPATEPTALTALALFEAGQIEAALHGANWLVALQNRDGSVGVGQDADWPNWPTSLAALTWRMASRHESAFSQPLELAIEWILATSSETAEAVSAIGHDGTIPAWPWVQGTHAWMEPTALHVLALKSCGYFSHERTRQAVRCLLDRQLPGGGWNYGNTTVLGNWLRPHLQPSGMALLGLIGERNSAHALLAARRYLRAQTGPKIPTASLCWSLLGLAGHADAPDSAASWLERSYRRVVERGGSPYKFALLAHASLGDRSPLLTLPTTAM